MRHPLTIALTALIAVSLVTAGCSPWAVNSHAPAPACVGNISADTTTFTAATWDSPPVVRRGKLVPYPPELASARRQVVALRFRVLATGAIDSTSIEVVSSTDARFNRYAIEGVRQMEMWPACKDGKAVASQAQQNRAFGRLEGSNDS